MTDRKNHFYKTPFLLSLGVVTCFGSMSVGQIKAWAQETTYSAEDSAAREAKIRQLEARVKAAEQEAYIRELEAREQAAKGNVQRSRSRAQGAPDPEEPGNKVVSKAQEKVQSKVEQKSNQAANRAESQLDREIDSRIDRVTNKIFGNW